MTSYIYDMVDTWNAGATTFTAVKMNVTDTASAAGSLLMDLQVGGSSRFNVGKTGSLKLGVSPTGTNQAGTNVIIAGSQGTGTGAGGSIVFQVAPAGSSGTAQNALATALTINADRTVTASGAKLLTPESYSIEPLVQANGVLGLFARSDSLATGIILDYPSQHIRIAISASAPRYTLERFQFKMRSDVAIAWTDTTSSSNSVTLQLAYDAANTLALRNGANAQFLRVYSTYTDASNYERGAINTGADFVELAAETAGTGDDNLDVRLTPAGTGNVRFGTHTATADTAVSGYIEIKDAGGTIRKLAVIT